MTTPGAQVPPKAHCLECGKRVAIRKNGTFWHHNGLEYDGMWGRTCENSGRTAPLLRESVK